MIFFGKRQKACVGELNQRIVDEFGEAAKQVVITVVVIQIVIVLIHKQHICRRRDGIACFEGIVVLTPPASFVELGPNVVLVFVDVKAKVLPKSGKVFVFVQKLLDELVVFFDCFFF